MAKDWDKENPNTQENHDEDIYDNIGEEYESLTTELLPTAVMQADKPSKKEKRKQNKREKKELRAQQAKLEKELIKEGKIAPRYRYVPRNNFARILSVCIAFVFGFFAAFGALIGGFAIFGDKRKLKDVTRIAGVDSAAIFTDYAADLSALDLIVEVVQKIKDGEFKTLGSVAVYTPYVDKLADQLVAQLADAQIKVEKAELMEVPFSGLGKWFRENVAGAYSDDYINTHTLRDVLGEKTDSSTILKSLENVLICDLGDEVQKLTLSDMIGKEELESNKILRSLGSSTLDTLSADVQKLSVEDVFGDDMYSYLSLTESEGKTYKEIVAEYKATNKATSVGSWKVPVAVELKAGEEIKTEPDGYYLYRNGEKADKLDRYLCGVWYLICEYNGDDEDDEQAVDTSIPILDISSRLAQAVNDMNGIPLWKLWLHDLIDQNPYKQLPGSGYELNGVTYTNLNEFTITGLIKYVQDVLLPNTP